MKLKRNALLVLILGFIILLIGAAMPFAYWMNYTERYGSVGIIGGADVPPTYWFWLYALFSGLPMVLVVVGITLLLSSAFCLAFSKTVKSHCRLKTTAISLGLSGSFVLGCICAFIWFTIAAFGEMSTYPVEYPVSIMLGVLCFVAFVLLAILYCKSRKTNWSIKGVMIDVLTGIVYLPVFYCVLAYLYAMLS